MNDLENCNAQDDCHVQTHVHEYLGSVRLAECNAFPHNHRFAGVTDEAYGQPNHVHVLKTRTDFYGDHFHSIYVITGPAICVGEGRHVHFVRGETSEQDGHYHGFIFATLINDPICD